jgi:hypothetical protein
MASFENAEQRRGVEDALMLRHSVPPNPLSELAKVSSPTAVQDGAIQGAPTSSAF